MSNTRLQRIIAVLLLVSPWIYVPIVFKEVLFIVLAFVLYLSTLDLKKKRETTQDFVPSSVLAETQVRETVA